jgi:septal ring factor EnvC (AmiA/AmiB activator)
MLPMTSSPQAVASLPAKSKKAVVRRLVEELVLREQIIRQLTLELSTQAQTAGNEASSGVSWQVVQQLHGRVRMTEQQLRDTRQELKTKQEQMSDLERLLTEIKTRNQQLTQLLQEAPELYRQQLADRLEPVRQRLADLHLENQHLKTELRSISYQLTAPNRPVARVELPKFVRSPQGMSLFSTAGLA